MDVSKNLSYTEARDILLGKTMPLGKEKITLSRAAGRVLGETVAAETNIPNFDKSPLDGYAFRGKDTRGASRENPVTLKIIEEVAAGTVPTKKVKEGEAVKILTGAPIPEGADAVAPYESTAYSKDEVTLFRSYKEGENIIYAGEDAKKGTLLADEGIRIDEAVCGMLSAMGKANPTVWKSPLVGILSTGRELVEAQETAGPGQIHNSNRHMLEAALHRAGFQTKYLGIAGDQTEEIAEGFRRGLACCDAVISTGGVSAGDYDLTPAAMEVAGISLLIQKVKLKPGMACAYGMKGRIPVFALSGNPISSLTNFFAVVLPVLRKLAGEREAVSPLFDVIMKNDFPKKSKRGRLLRGKLVIEDAVAYMEYSQAQGNIVMSSAVGMNMMAIVPEGSDCIRKGTKLKGFML